MHYLCACSDYSTNLPGSTCKIVFTLSKNTLARFSSPFDAPTLKTCVDRPIFESAVISGSAILVLFVKGIKEDLRVNISYTSDCLRGPALSVKGFIGSAVTCGMYLPLEAIELMSFSPRISLKSSSFVGFIITEGGRSSFASSVARAINVERGRVTPRVSWMRFWTEITNDRETGMATSVSVGSSSCPGAS